MNYTICIPSNKNFDDSFASIKSALIYSELTNSKIIISDNSGCHKKSEYYANLDFKNLTYQNTYGKDATDNWISTFEYVSTEFLSFFCDDDLIFKISDNEIDHTEIDASVVTIRPSILHWNKISGIYSSSNFTINNLLAKERLEKYISLNGGHNTTLFSKYRSNIIIPLYQMYNQYHPTRAGYTDWSLVFSLITSGKVINDPNFALIYRNTNWYGTSSFINNNIVDLFTAANLPEKSSILLPLFKALDSFILIMRNFSPISFDERISSAAYILLVLINDFLATHRSLLSKFSARELELFSNLSNIKSLATALDVIMKIISLQRDDLHEKYLSFYFHSAGHEFGSLR